VGKAAISGWQEVIEPARKAGARLWPFDGSLSELCGTSSLVICETYPRVAFGQVGVRFRPGQSKLRQKDRQMAIEGLASRSMDKSIRLNKAMLDAISDGFGARDNGDDQFDAAVGLLGMIEVVEGRRPERSPAAEHLEWEGWILGRTS
jgi:hypothetical protein